ncbi:MAG: TRAP transporter substrate-binding protein DctP [Deltaproteobacteria bacterium]|nr:TRAP transporter substrate-binding protein DctP [Deltaproteobacteria bacterium]
MLARVTRLLALVVLLLALAPPSASAQTVIKLATVLPASSPWGKMLTTIAARWKEASGARVTLKVYAGATMGDESAIVKKMRIGQLQAGAISTIGLYDIEPSSLVLDLPRFVRTKEERDHLLAKIAPKLEKALADKGYVVLGWAWIGHTHLFSTTARATLPSARTAKLFMPNGLPALKDLAVALGFKPVLLSWIDLVPSLTTGLIDAAFLPPSVAQAAQVHLKAKFQGDLRWSMLDGAFVVKSEAWATVPADLQAKLKAIVVEAGKAADIQADQAEASAINAMKAQGLQVTSVTDAAEWDKAVAGVEAVVRGKLVSAAIYDEAKTILATFRATGTP